MPPIAMETTKPEEPEVTATDTINQPKIEAFAASVAGTGDADAKTHECDFDKAPTQLYTNLQQRKWEATIQRSHEDPAEAKTWVSRKESDGRLRWRLLPLHAAIIFSAPETVVEALLGAYPKGAESKDDQGMLPLHLAFRHGSTEGVVNLLLVAYPQSIDVKDRKGRIPLVLAQASTSPNRDAFMRALERGPTYYAVAAAATERAAVTAELRAIFDAKLIEIKNSHAHEVETLRGDAAAKRAELEDKVSGLEQELSKTQETSQVLVDHVNSLEAQLSSRSDTERFLATKIATLDTSLRDISRVKEENESSFEAENGALRAENLELKATMEKLQKEHKEATENKTTSEVRAEELAALLAKNSKKSEEAVHKLEIEWANAKANGAILEGQLKKKIETEHALATQVSNLASQLAESATESSKVNSNYVQRIEFFELENKDLKELVVNLTKKLSSVVTVLQSITDEQSKLVDNAAMEENVMAKAASAHAKIVADASRQEDFFNKARNERKEMMELLKKQQEEMDQADAERANVLDSVKAQGEQMAVVRAERETLMSGVKKQKSLVQGIVDNELFLVPASLDGQDDNAIVTEVLMRVREEAARIEKEDKAELDNALGQTQDEDDKAEKEEEEIIEEEIVEEEDVVEEEVVEEDREIAIEASTEPQVEVTSAEAETEVEAIDTSPDIVPAPTEEDAPDDEKAGISSAVSEKGEAAVEEEEEEPALEEEEQETVVTPDVDAPVDELVAPVATEPVVAPVEKEEEKKDDEKDDEEGEPDVGASKSEEVTTEMIDRVEAARSAV